MKLNQRYIPKPSNGGAFKVIVEFHYLIAPKIFVWFVTNREIKDGDIVLEAPIENVAE